jgi:hypothetical protein
MMYFLILSWLGEGVRIQGGDPETDLPGPVSAQLGDAGCTGFAAGPHHSHAPGATRAPAWTQLPRYVKLTFLRLLNVDCQGHRTTYLLKEGSNSK